MNSYEKMRYLKDAFQKLIDVIECDAVSAVADPTEHFTPSQAEGVRVYASLLLGTITTHKRDILQYLADHK